MYELSIKSLLAPSFYEVWRDARQNKHTHYWLKGGRGSTKSSFISLFLIIGIMRKPKANAIVFRKIERNLKSSVYEQLLWAIDVLGVGAYWNDKLSPLELVYIPTGQKILFRGADKPKKIKSIKFSKGFCKYVWFEEVDEFNGADEIRTILQSLLRGGENQQVFYSYNPPASVNSWVNSEVLDVRNDKYVHHSNYLDVPKQWLGETFIVEAEHLKQVKPDKYRHEYLGEIIGTGAEVFTNLNFREISQEEINLFDKIKRGLDWGYAGDPLHYTGNYYDTTRKRLFIFYEIHKVRLSTEDLANAIKKQNPLNEVVTTDTNDSRGNSDLWAFGINVNTAIKGKGSVRHGIKWLQDLEEIVIDPIRCPNTAREFSEYELERDNNGNLKGDFPDKNNHSIDATRYALEEYIRGKIYH